MARPNRRLGLTGLAIASAFAAGLSLAAVAQHGTAAPPASASETKSEPTLPPVSRDCQAGSPEVASGASFPNVAKALRERSKIVILVVGSSPFIRRDSGSGGYYDLVESLLEQTFKGLHVSIVHRGVPGELARDAGARIKMEVGLVDPDLVLWQVGTADALARLPVEGFDESVSSTLAWLKSHDTDAVLIGLHYVKALTKDAHYQAIRKSLKKIAGEQGVLRISRYEAAETIARIRSEKGTPPMSNERLSEAAYECSAEYLARAIAAGLFLKQPKDGAPPVKPAEK